MSNITTADLPLLKRNYNACIKKGNDTFKFKDSMLITSYAKYLIQYLKQLKKKYYE